jgi:exosortase
MSDATTATIDVPIERNDHEKPLSQTVLEIVQSEPFRYGLLIFAGIVASFWPLIRDLPSLWQSEDGYYSHGFLVPFIAGYIVYRRWPKLEKIPVKTGWAALLFLIPVLALNRVAAQTDIKLLMSANLVTVLFLGVWFTAGFRWALGVAVPILYLLFCLPVWVSVIEIYTNPLQVQSTQVAFQLLKALGFQPLRPDSTTILLNSFTLDVGVPCSGLKLLLALSCFTMFFVLIANLKWLANSLMVLLVVPFALLMNGLRIALIGVVGDTMGEDAGRQFHDWSGYIMLLLCFVIIFKFARILGWKD